MIMELSPTSTLLFRKKKGQFILVRRICENFPVRTVNGVFNKKNARPGASELRLQCDCPYSPSYDARAPERECSDLSLSAKTAHPIYDPDCRQCAEARFADRLCESLHENCNCTPVIRTDRRGSISLLHTSAPKRQGK
ncbi:hypothetical protein Y032_0345g3118 [Ancylostoma ceylanicum]|uniref:Uncharacterized protein n=2 Tax=Ancylostoma ceylanicum TaxID=53326 RepID=A0A016RXE4_9BILA|nr:hypothetical protein Y032_0345g3118 [Ancylostoma ceylanicum]